MSFLFPYILPKLEYSREEICHHMQYGRASNVSDIDGKQVLDEGNILRMDSHMIQKSILSDN